MTDPGVTLATQSPDPARLVDTVPGGRLLVIGSLPPQGRDLDLAMRRRDVAAVDATLVANGFLRQGGQYVLFSEGTAQVVDTTILEDWGLPEDEIDLLLTQARTLPGMGRLARPAPPHVLLLLAPECARRGSLTPRRRARLEQALLEDPGAWRSASRHAPAWRAIQALALLHRVADGDPPSLLTRIGALAEPRRATGASRARAAGGAVRRVARQRRLGAVVALSGVDGAGKSSQAAALAATLELLGEEPVVVWSRVRYDPLLAGIGRVVKTLLAPVGADRSGTVSLHARPATGHEQAPHQGRHPAPARLFEVAWAHVSGVVDGYRHLRLCVPGVLRGKIVICDRYTLDTHVHLVERFHAQPGAARGAAWLDRVISPRPLRTFWLDVPARSAWQRKPDDVEVHRLRDHTRLYLALHGDHDAIRLDAEGTLHEVAATMASTLWHARSRRVRRTRRPSRRPGASREGLA